MTVNSLTRSKPAAPKEPGMNDIPTPTRTGVPIPDLTGADRCESCNQPAQSAWLVTSASVNPLLFCGHHTRRHLAKLQAAAPFASLINPGVTFP
ncbi:hypothetical protein GCM10025867_48490 (plasmid) [Frondihabitans sucicola]|uniref:DUF7455 domain-containing protein n=1 Tax=Frondihabitans sucicola TaxID=1268041 RepID=A0ABM8GVV4_9MICO|nr:hypothetical protein [Frondihabitans sucicola]BDZ52608.1 hypothetical protein GCM10025867_48490 [Frondihabitans sucicola]